MARNPKYLQLIEKAQNSVEYGENAEFHQVVETAKQVLLSDDSRSKEILAAIKSIKEWVKKARGITGAPPPPPDHPSENSNLPEALKESLERAHAEELEKWQWYGVLETNENGKLKYTADYDGTHEKNNQGENFTGQSFEVPTISEVLTQLTPEQIELIKAMEAAGEEPRLQLTPLALNIRTLAGKLDVKKEAIGEPFTEDTYVWDEIKDAELIYEAASFQASEDGKELHTTNGLTKSQYINKYGGWAIEIVATKQNLTDTKEGTNAQKTEKYMEEAIQKGYRGLTYESYLSAQMQRLKADPENQLDKETFTILPDSNLTSPRDVATADWDVAQVDVTGSFADHDNHTLRCRRSVRVGRSEA
ncbi:hypothetical protein GF340_01010 [Candidatus Peregrinibacteria bacterium]|nr:hypothetical protein [Candidatus Peregrinibacteria bacterium]